MIKTCIRDLEDSILGVLRGCKDMYVQFIYISMIYLVNIINCILKYITIIYTILFYLTICNSIMLEDVEEDQRWTSEEWIRLDDNV